MTKLYALFGGGVLLLMGLAHWFSWGADDSDSVTGVPRTVRDNPGVYRTHYVGGK